jgi:hypothetical protein
MSIVLDENIVGIWYALTGEKDDFMLAISKCAEGLELVYRHRYYASDDPWDERDKKSWYRMVTKKNDVQHAIETAREMVQGVAMIAVKMGRLMPPAQVFELVRGDKSVEDFAEVLMSMPWAHSMAATRH